MSEKPVEIEDVLSERVCAAIDRRLEGRMLEILQVVRDALNSGYEEGYHSMGGPQDGESSPSRFIPSFVMRSLNDQIKELSA